MRKFLSALLFLIIEFGVLPPHTLSGDATVSAAKGILLAAAGGTYNTGPISGQEGDASQFYLYGTQGDVIDIFLV